MEIQVESILFEDAIDALVDAVLAFNPPGYLHLPWITITIMQHVKDPEKMASLAAQAVLMLAEQRRENVGVA